MTGRVSPSAPTEGLDYFFFSVENYIFVPVFRMNFNGLYMKKLILFAAAAMLLFSCTPVEINPGGNTPSGDTPEDKPATVQVTGITLDKTEVFIKEGESVTLVPTVKPDNATNKAVTWTSGNEAVATVDNSGKVTGVKAGTAIIIAATQDGGKTATCAVTVNALTVLVTGITLDTSLDLEEGKSVTLIATVKPDNAFDKSLTWSSSNESVAAVDQNGKVTAKSKGTATIKATANDGSGKYAECSVRVYKIDGDLGLSVKWATSNLCETGLCSNIWDYGDYYAWGETVPYYQSGHSLDSPCSSWRLRSEHPISGYNWISYKFRTSGNSWNNLKFSKYNTKESYGPVDNIMELQRGEKSGETIDDVARAKLGGKWRMPTEEEWTELRTKCTWAWKTNYNESGINGRLVTGPNGNSIFLPATGYRDVKYLGDAGSLGYCWSSSLNTDDPRGAYCVYFDSGGVYGGSGGRSGGQSVRPVSER